MLFAETLSGIILIICGILVKKYPNLIAGYNTLSAEEKKKIDIKRLSNFMHNSLIIIGALSIVVAIALYTIGIKESYRFIISTSIVIIGVIFMLVEGNAKN
ncbi:MAG: hypothetical protein DA407_08765 [Bacteroidetes bacterium]|nr:MAG: hypothetical protein DA407_08765 [Bacteroidota bacterium]